MNTGHFPPSLTYEDIHAVIAAVELHGGPSAAAKALGKGEGSLSHALREARKLGIYPPSTRGPVPGRKAASKDFGYRRHLIIPDTQVKPGVPMDHLDWAGRAIVDYRPDVIVHIGDHWDFPSLNGHEEPGSEFMEGKRFKDDVDAGNLGFQKLCAPMEAEQARPGNRWNPEKHYACGNHDVRPDRVAKSDPKWMGHVGSNHCNMRDFKVHRFLEVFEIDGFSYSHFFRNTHSSHAIGGEVPNRLNKIGSSFVCGHEQGKRFGTKITATGRTLYGFVVGSYYLHREEYMGNQGQSHWKGLLVLNEARDGRCDVMTLSIDYLCRRYEGMRLLDFMNKKYPGGDWSHLA